LHCSHWQRSAWFSQPRRPLVGVAAVAAVTEAALAAAAVTEAALAVAAVPVAAVTEAASTVVDLVAVVSIQRLLAAEVSARPLLGVVDFAVELSPPMVFEALVFTRASATGGDLRSVHLHSE